MSKLLSEEIKYNGIRFKVIQRKYQRKDGLEYIRDCVEPGDAVVILPITKENEIIFVKQLREVIGKLALELPAGMIDAEETPEQAARRELEEETGIKANNIEFLTSYYSSCGYTSEKIYIYIAKDFSYGKQHFDETEEILKVEKIKVEEALEKIFDEKFCHASTKVGILTYYYKYCNGGKIDGKHKANA